jgi:hypothetical protein
MSEPRDPLIDAIHAAGEVPPAPDRDAAFARAMQPVLIPSRRRLSRSVIALFAAALLAAPVAVFAAHESHQNAVVTPIVSERPDPGSSIQTETDDATLQKEVETAHRSGLTETSSATDDHGGIPTVETEHQSVDSPTTSGTDGSGSGGSDDGVSPSPTPVPNETQISSPDGGLSGSDGGSITSSDGGTSGSH